MAGMRDALRKRFEWMPPGSRERAFDDAFQALKL